MAATDWGKIHLLEARIALGKRKLVSRRQHLATWLHEEKVWQQGIHTAEHFHNSKAFERAKTEFHRAVGLRKKWELKVHQEHQEIHRLQTELNKLKPPPPKPKGEGFSVPAVSWNPYRRPIANWIIPILQWAHEHGWTGYVTSGYRSPAEQERAARNYARERGVPVWVIYPNGVLASNHVRYVYPGGAVDVTNYGQLAQVLRGYHGSRRLVWAGPIIGDYVHFSANGH